MSYRESFSKERPMRNIASTGITIGAPPVRADDQGVFKALPCSKPRSVQEE
jgi:hypothetical protein